MNWRIGTIGSPGATVGAAVGVAADASSVNSIPAIKANVVLIIAVALAI
jgi:hypothetical protein